MRISAKAEYACLAIIELARSGGVGARKRVRELSEAQGIPERYLIQILLQLKAAGIVRSERGSLGGYQLSRDPSQISVAEVIAAIDGRGEQAPKRDSTAGRDLSQLLARAREAEWGVLAGTSVAQLAGSDAQPDWVL
jgi:Rrf2 family transcriptional regulator, cysteine metabolism repressor